MPSTKKGAKELKPFNFLRDILYPACIIFTVILIGTFLMFFALGENVTESRDFVTYERNEYLESHQNKYFYEVGEEKALSVLQIFGFLLFSFSLPLLSLLKYSDFSAVWQRLIHYIGSTLAFFIFIILFSEILPGAGLAVILFVCFSLAYFILLGLKQLLRLIHIPKNKVTGALEKYLPMIFTVFTVCVLIMTLLARFLKVQVQINLVGPVFTDERISLTTWETLITPIAPTLQNYFRWLGTSAFIVLGIALFKLISNVIIKTASLFFACGVGIALMWFIQLDFFKEIDGAFLYALLGYIAVFIIAATVYFIIIRSKSKKTEDLEEYTRVFK